MATSSKFHSLFEEQTVELLKNVRVIDQYKNNGQEIETENPIEYEEKVLLGDPGKIGMSCAVCQVTTFDSVKAQRDHFKLDWHRYNVKQRLMNKPTIQEEDFEETVSGELSSISGSESEDSEDSNEDFELEGVARQLLPQSPDITPNEKKSITHQRNHPKLFLSSGNGQIFTFYRAVTFTPRNLPENDFHLIKSIQKLPEETWWIIIMTAGGHFAAAVFDGDSVAAHKTFHRYTVRAKRGTVQGVRDSQQGGKAPKSAGACLRRYNEAALVQEVKELLDAWSEYLQKCHKIFIRIPTYNKPMFFGGKSPPLNKNDPRIRTIPFATRRPTFKEIRRVQEELSRIHILGSNEDVLEDVIKQLSPQKQNSSPMANDMSSRSQLDFTDGNMCDGIKDVTINDSSSTKETKNGSNKKVKKKKKNVRLAGQSGQEKISHATRSPEGSIVSAEHHLWNRFYCAVVSGNTKAIAEMVSYKKTTTNPDSSATAKNSVSNKRSDENELETKIAENIVDGASGAYNEENCVEGDSNVIDVLKVLNERWGETGSTLLHVASRTSQTEIIYSLLYRGADPCIRDDSGKTPYDKAKSKEARDQFRSFMADHPDAFDYSQSHIPSPLTQEMKDEKERKEAEKKKAQRKAKKHRAREQKANEQMKLEEETERKKKETMSEREKRALAAEKRYAKQIQSSGSSCAMCSQDLAGCVPFERLIYKYCSTACVRQHRLILENKDK